MENLMAPAPKVARGNCSVEKSCSPHYA